MGRKLSRKEFEAWVEEALDGLPAAFARLLDNVVVTVEDEPEPEDYDETETPDDEELFGVFRGPMRTELSFEATVPVLPAQVVIFRGPILRNTDTKGEAIREIQDTVRHELGHYFGLEDEEMPY